MSDQTIYIRLFGGLLVLLALVCLGFIVSAFFVWLESKATPKQDEFLERERQFQRDQHTDYKE